MSSVGRDKQLLQAVFDRNFDAVKIEFEAGASVNGHPEANCTPVAAATLVKHARMVGYLLDKGADPDRSVTVNPQCPKSAVPVAVPGERALHIAAWTGNIDILHLLLKKGRADPNVTDSEECTPLMRACENPNVDRGMVQLLLEAGADPSLAQQDGLTPLHMAALHGNVDLVDMLVSKSAGALNRCGSGLTPLFMACDRGHASTVSRLLALGAVQPVASEEHCKCPFAVAVHRGFEGVVRVVINEGGIPAVGGEKALCAAFCLAVRLRRATILRLLLTCDRVQGKSVWADRDVKRLHPLHYSAFVCYPAAVSILLKAGMDEAARDHGGQLPRDIIGLCLMENVWVDWGEATAIRRMLHRGPAYRARSWAWPSGQEPDGYRSGDGATTDTAAAVDVRSSPQAVNHPPCIGVQVIKLKETGGSKSFVRVIGRYCAKN